MKQRNQLSADDLTGKIKAFMDAGDDYFVVVMDYNPELRYFLHQVELFESNLISLYDNLQLHQSINQKVITFSDLCFPKEAYLIYTPFNILVYLDGELIGKITQGLGSQILEVIHYSGGVVKCLEMYDDRGFLSSRKHYADGVLIYTELLDIDGNWIFREFSVSGQCELNKENKKGLKKLHYANKEELQFELLHNILNNSQLNDKIVISVTDQNIEEIQKSPFLEAMTLSVFQQRWSWSQKGENVLLEILEKSHAFIIDTEYSFKEIKKIITKRKANKIFHLTPYDTRFKISITQEINDEVIYLDARFLKYEDVCQAIEIIFDYMIPPLQKENSQRNFKVIVRTENYSEQYKIKDVIEKFFQERYALEIRILDQIKNPQTKENNIEEEKLEGTYPNLSIARQLKQAWKINVLSNEDDLFKIIHEARLIIDLSQAPDLLTQIAGISAAIPQINITESDYVHDGKNGKIIKDITELSGSLQYYLESLKNWQKARAFSAQKIKEYSGGELREALCHIIGIKPWEKIKK